MKQHQRKTNQEPEPEQKKKRRRKEKPPVIKKTTRDILPILEYDATSGCYRLEDDSYLDILQIVCKDLVAINDTDRQFDYYTLMKLERVFQDDHKKICLNVPTKTNKQISFLQHKMNTCTDPYRLRQLEIKKRELEWIQKNRSGKEFFIMFFSSNLDEHQKQVNTIISVLQPIHMIRIIDQAKKDELLEKLCNKLFWH